VALWPYFVGKKKSLEQPAASTTDTKKKERRGGKEYPLFSRQIEKLQRKNLILFYFYVHCLSLPTAVIDEPPYSDLMDGKPPYGFVFLLEIHAKNGCLVFFFFFSLRKS
jgi:hypothetical protein